MSKAIPAAAWDYMGDHERCMRVLERFAKATGRTWMWRWA